MYSRKVLRSGFAYFLVSLASCTAGISIHPDIPRQTLMLSQHGCRQASFSLPLQGQFIPNPPQHVTGATVLLIWAVGFNVLRDAQRLLSPLPLGVRVY